MRCFSLGLLALVVVHPAIEPSVEPERAVPRFILQKGDWICVDRNPRQIKRQDCAPRFNPQRTMSRPD